MADTSFANGVTFASSPKFCIDCKHSRIPQSGDIYRMTCASPRNSVPYADRGRYLVSGIDQVPVDATIGSNCAVLRRSQYHPVMSDLMLCGELGEWFEGKA